MLAPFVPILAACVFLGFFALMFLSKADKNKLYVQYILLAFPLIATTVIPGGLGINNFDIITWLFLLIFYKPKKVHIKSGLIYLALFLIIIAISIGGCYYAESLTEETFRTYLELFATFIFAKIIIDECIDDPSFFYVVIKCLRTSLIVSLAFLACQFVLGVEFSIARTLNGNVMLDDAVRYPSFFQDPQKYAQFLAACSFLFLIREPGQTKLPAKNYVFLILTLIGILYTGGRAGLGGWALGFSLIVIFGNANLKLYATIVAIAMFVVIYNFKDSFSVFNRGENISDSYDFRMGIWRDAYNIFLNHPFFGIAPGNYANYVSVHNPDQFWFVENDFLYYDHPESGYLKFLTEYGAIGFICILLLFIIPMINAFFSYLKWRDTTFLLLISAILSWMAGFYTVYSLGDVRIQIMVTAIICLMITAYKRFDLPEEQEETEEEEEEEHAAA
jgi:O-antigen ligase